MKLSQNNREILYYIGLTFVLFVMVICIVYAYTGSGSRGVLFEGFSIGGGDDGKKKGGRNNKESKSKSPQQRMLEDIENKNSVLEDQILDDKNAMVDIFVAERRNTMLTVLGEYFSDKGVIEKLKSRIDGLDALIDFLENE